MTEKKEFVADDAVLTTAQEKNTRLIEVINDDFMDKDIVLIERIEIAAQGWRITHRK